MTRGARAIAARRFCTVTRAGGDAAGGNFVRALIARDTAAGGRVGPSRSVVLRFPPEPSGFLHIGHAKAACLNFGLSEELDAPQRGAWCNLRFDDSNPDTSKAEYVASIEDDIRWLGFKWDGAARFASDYFERLWACAEHLVRSGDAYVCSLSAEEWREHRGTTLHPGRASPHRGRSVEENLRLLREMRAGAHADGAHVLRAKIDGALNAESGVAGEAMASSNIHMRDPAIYRIRHATHHRTGDAWCVYPMYDFAHCLSDAFEGITHSLCTLEFQEHRPLYEWFLQTLAQSSAGSALLDMSASLPRIGPPTGALVAVTGLPRQTEFSRLNVSNTVTSKRFLRALVEAGHVEGWDDPRLPTLAGLRRRGIPPAAIRRFCAAIGLSRADDAIVDVAMLEACAREVLDDSAPRAMCVLRPLRVVIETLSERAEAEASADGTAFRADAAGDAEGGVSEWLSLSKFPKDGARGQRRVPLTREIFIDRSDFREEEPPPPPASELALLSKKAQKRLRSAAFNRLTLHQPVRLRGAYVISVSEVVRDDATNEIVALRCTHDDTSLGKTIYINGAPGEGAGGESVAGGVQPGVVHWVSAERSIDAEVFVYKSLFAARDPLARSESGGEDGAPNEEGAPVGGVGMPGGAADAIAIPAVNPDSVEILRGCRAELSVADDAESGDVLSGLQTPTFQFEREGYFCVDRDSVHGLRAAAEAATRGNGAVGDEAPPPPVRFNQTIALRAAKASTWK